MESSIEEGIVLRSNDVFLETNDNLIKQIARQLIERFRPRSGLIIDVFKRIPAGAGLAGNSADGAALIEAVNELWNLRLTKQEMQAFALPFGADLPYCFETDVCRVEGIGESITPLGANLKGKPCLVVTPKAYVATKSMFAVGDAIGFQTKPIAPLIAALNAGDWTNIKRLVHNSFAPITLSESPKTAAVVARLKAKFGEEGLFMTGTGSTWIYLPDQLDASIWGFCDEYTNDFQASVHIFL
ncbi:MAG: hypothetical protein MZU97_21625 [Bacillus subtilis]|nr:hypothetical protein [Bacillus subtilis]